MTLEVMDRPNNMARGIRIWRTSGHSYLMVALVEMGPVNYACTGRSKT